MKSLWHISVLFVALAVLIPRDSSAAANAWTTMTDHDEMTGQEETYARQIVSIGGKTIRTQATCRFNRNTSNAELHIEVAVSSGSLATYLHPFTGRMVSDARIDVGTGKVDDIDLYLGSGNVYFASVGTGLSGGTRFIGDARDFKLEVQFDNGATYIVRGDEKLSRGLSPCYIDRATLDAEAAEAARAAEAVAVARAEEIAAFEAEQAAIYRPKFASTTDEVIEAHRQCFGSKLFNPDRGEGRLFDANLVIGVDGEVKNVTVVRSTGDSRIDKLAICTIKRLRFSPAQKDGQPVEADGKQQFEFPPRPDEDEAPFLIR